VDRAASRKAHDHGASALKPATALVMLRRFSDSGYPSYGCGAARATSFGAWLGTTPVGWIGNESGNGEKCSRGRRTDLFLGAKARAGAQQQPDPNLQLNLGFGERIGK
jgi:hypothetical protein